MKYLTQTYRIPNSEAEKKNTNSHKMWTKQKDAYKCKKEVKVPNKYKEIQEATIAVK